MDQHIHHPAELTKGHMHRWIGDFAIPFIMRIVFVVGAIAQHALQHRKFVVTRQGFHAFLGAKITVVDI